jgi:hypothetical protein
MRDHGGQALTYVYFEDEPGRRFGGYSANSAETLKALFLFVTNSPKISKQILSTFVIQI